MINKINIGLQPNDGTGDSIRDAFHKVNLNFDNLTDRVLAFDSIEDILALKANRSEIPSIEGLASEIWVRQLINDTDVDLSDYFTKSETLARIAEAQLDGGDVDLSGYATTTFVNNGLNLKADKTELQNYATKTYVNQQINGIDLTPYATRTWVNQQINSQSVDLSNYYDKVQVDNLLVNKANRNEIPSIVGLASEAYVNQQIANIPEVDLSSYYTKSETAMLIMDKVDRSELEVFATKAELPTRTSQLTNDSGYVMASALNGYATESYVMNAIANAELGEGQSIDLTIYETIAANDAKLSLKANLTDIPSLQGYATQLYVDNKIALIPTVDLTPYALKTDLNGLATNASVDQKLSNKADRSEIPNISGLASEAWVNQQIANIPPSGGDVDLSDYYRKSETYSKVEIDNKMSSKANVSDIPSVAGLASETYVNQQIANIPQVDLDGYATEQYVNTQISNINIPSQVNVFANGYGIYSIGSVFSGTNISISNTTELNNKTLVNESGTYTITGIGNDIMSAFNITNLTANASVTIQPIAGKTITINGELVTVATTLNQTLKPLLFFIHNQYVIIRY